MLKIRSKLNEKRSKSRATKDRNARTKEWLNLRERCVVVVGKQHVYRESGDGGSHRGSHCHAHQYRLHLLGWLAVRSGRLSVLAGRRLHGQYGVHTEPTRTEHRPLPLGDRSTALSTPPDVTLRRRAHRQRLVAVGAVGPADSCLALDVHRRTTSRPARYDARRSVESRLTRSLCNGHRSIGREMKTAGRVDATPKEAGARDPKVQKGWSSGEGAHYLWPGVSRPIHHGFPDTICTTWLILDHKSYPSLFLDGGGLTGHIGGETLLTLTFYY